MDPVRSRKYFFFENQATGRFLAMPPTENKFKLFSPVWGLLIF